MGMAANTGNSVDRRHRNREASKAHVVAAASPQLEYVCSLSAFLHYVQVTCCITTLALSISYPRWLTAAGGAWVVLTVLGAILFSAYSFTSKMPVMSGRCSTSRQLLVDLIGYAACTIALMISVVVCSYAVTHRYFVDTLEDGRSVVSGVMHVEACIFFVSAALLTYGLRTCIILRQWRAS